MRTFATICFIIHCFNSQCQNHKSTLQIENYIGLPNAGSSFFQMITFDQHWGKLKGFGPIGMRMYYTKSHRLNFGLDICFTNTQLIFDKRYTQGATVKYRSSKIGALVCLKYQLLSSEKLKLNSNFGFGYGISRISMEKELSSTYNIPSPRLSSICFRIGLNVEFKLTKELYLNSSIGLGQGGMINIGTTYIINSSK
jgi:hypothetical protein